MNKTLLAILITVSMSTLACSTSDDAVPSDPVTSDDLGGSDDSSNAESDINADAELVESVPGTLTTTFQGVEQSWSDIECSTAPTGGVRTITKHEATADSYGVIVETLFQVGRLLLFVDTADGERWTEAEEVGPDGVDLSFISGDGGPEVVDGVFVMSRRGSSDQADLQIQLTCGT